jgi:phage terminase small subunit
MLSWKESKFQGDWKLPKKELTVQQELFCQEYVVDFNGTQAAIRAHYSKKSAAMQASRLLTNDKVVQKVQELIAARSKRIEITADRVLEELGRIAFARMSDLATWSGTHVKLKDSSDLSDDQLAAVLEVSETVTKDGGSLRVKQHDKVKALELLGKHFKLYTNKLEVSGKLTLEDLVAGSMTGKEEDKK